MKTILITGMSGFIGSNLYKKLKDNYKILGIDIRWPPKSINYEGPFMNGLIENVDLDNLYKDEKISCIVHLAALVDTTESDAVKMMEQNVVNHMKLLEYAIENNIKFVYASSAGVFNDKGDQYLPTNLYGLSKYLDELASNYYFQKGKKDIVGLRFYNVFGPGESQKGNMSSKIYRMILDVKEDKQPELFKYGEQSRDFIYIDDVVDSIECAIKSPVCQSSGFDICTGVSTTFNDVLKYINEYFKKDMKPVYVDNPYIGSYQEYTKGNPGYATTQLKFAAKWKIKDAIFDYCKKLENEEI